MRHNGLSANEYRERARRLREIAPSDFAHQSLLMGVADQCEQMANVLDLTDKLPLLE